MRYNYFLSVFAGLCVAVTTTQDDDAAITTTTGKLYDAVIRDLSPIILPYSTATLIEETKALAIDIPLIATELTGVVVGGTYSPSDCSCPTVIVTVTPTIRLPFSASSGNPAGILNPSWSVSAGQSSGSASSSSSSDDSADVTNGIFPQRSGIDATIGVVTKTSSSSPIQNTPPSATSGQRNTNQPTLGIYPTAQSIPSEPLQAGYAFTAKIIAQATAINGQPGQFDSMSAGSMEGIVPNALATTLEIASAIVDASVVANDHGSPSMIMPGALSTQQQGQAVATIIAVAPPPTTVASVPGQGSSSSNDGLLGVWGLWSESDAANVAAGQVPSYGWRIDSVSSTLSSAGSASYSQGFGAESWSGATQNGQLPSGQYSIEWQAASLSNAASSTSAAERSRYTGKASRSMIANSIAALIVVLSIMVAL